MKLILLTMIWLVFTHYSSNAAANCMAIDSYIGQYQMVAGNCKKTLGPDTLVSRSYLKTGQMIYRISNSAMGISIIADSTTPGFCEITDHGIIVIDKPNFRIELSNQITLINYKDCTGLFQKTIDSLD